MIILVKTQAMSNREDANIVREIYHAHYTANLIEDEIRRIRSEDYELRRKYDVLVNGVKEEVNEDGAEEEE